MAKLKSSKEILEQAKNNLKKEEDYKKNINEMELEVEKNTEEFNEELNNSSTSIVTIHEEFSRHTENINKLVNNIVSSVMQLNQTVKVYTSNNQITNSLLASNLVSLGQITSVLSAFRADYIMIQNGKDINGDGYYDKNLINDITKGIKNIKDKNIKKMIQELSTVGNFANVMSNAVRPRVGNNRRAGSGNGEGLFSRLLGRFLPEDYKDIASPILQMLPMFGIDDSNIKNLATSILNKKDPNASKKYLDPLNQAITDILNSPDDASGKGIFKKFLAGKFADITGFGDAKGKVREKNPKKVLAALAPLADDIKDMVEFKKEAFIKTPSILKKKAIYAVPVWIVNSSYQENGLKKKYDTSNDELEILMEKIKNIVSGNSSNLKDKNGELLFNYDPTTGEYEGELAERFLELIGKKDASYDEREKSIRNIYNQGLNKNKFDYDNIYYTDTNIDENGEIHYEQKKHTSKLGKNLTTIDLKNFDKAFELAQGGPIGAAMNIFTGGLRDVGGVKGFIRGLGSDVKSIWSAGKESLPHHKGGRKAKRNKRNNQIEVAVLHQDEKVLKPEELSRQQSINDISKAFSISISALSTLNELSKLRLMLFNKWVNKEQIDPQKVKISSTVAGSDFIKNHLGKDAKFSLRKFREISLSLPDLIPKPKKEIQHEKHLKMKDIWGEKEKANIAEEESKDAKDDAEKTKDEANEKIEEQISNAEKEAQENAEQQIQENAEQSEAKVAEAQEQQEQQAQSEISQHQEQMENEVQEVKNEQQAKADKEKEVIKEEQEKRDKMKQEHSEEMSKLKEDDSVSRRKNKKEHNIKMLAKEKAGKIKNWGIKKAGNIKAWALEKKSKIKQNKTKFKKLVKRLARKSKKLVKLLSRKLKSIGKRMIKKLMASKLAAKIKSIGAFGSNIIKMAGKGIKAVITALKAIPLYGKIAAIGVSVAAALGITAMVAGFKSAAKKGKDGAKDDSEKLIKQADKNGDKYKKEAEKDEKKKKKKEKQEEKQETKENKELEKEDKNDNKNENAKQLLSALTNPIGFVAKKLSEKLKRRKVYISENGVVIDSETNKPIKSNENPNEFLMKDSNEFEKRKYEFNIENNLKTNIRNKIKNVVNKTKEKLSSSNYNKNNKNNKFTNNPMDIFKYMNANMLSSLMKFTDSNLGRKFINDPEKAANFMFLLNGGANALGMRDAKNDVLGNIQGASSVTSTSFGGLFSGLLKRKLKTSDIGNKDNNYSENIDLAYSQVKQAENANNLINAFGIGLGLTEISDNGKALFTSDLVKQEQAAAFAAAAQAGGTSSTVSASDISDGSETDTVGTCGTYGSSSVSNNTPYEKYVRTCSSNGKVNKVTNSYNSYMLKNTKSNKIDFIKDYYKKFSSSLIHLNANDQKTAYTTFLNDVLDSTYYKSSTERTRRSILRSLSDNGFDFAKYGKGKNYGIARRRSSIDNDFLSASKYALQNNYKEKNGGTYPKFFKDYLSKSGINVKQNSSTEKIKSSLMNGSPVILMGKDEYETGKTPFGSEPHYVVATGYDGKNIRIEDSESETGGDIYDANSVLSHSSLKMVADEDSNVSSNSYRSYSGSNNNSHNSLRNYRTQSANSLYKNYNRIYSSSTNNSSTTKKNYIVSGKAKYGKGYNETIESNPTILKGAQDGWTQYGILASVTLAQAILESGLGTSTIAREANNWFGHSYGFGSSKYTVGKYISSNGRSWAKYANAGDSFRDHAYVLSGQSGNTRYVAAVGETDPLKCITAIENGGYCEGDKQSYINKVMDIINSYNLTKYDTGTFNGKAAGGTAYSKTCWTGDSRTVQMHNYFTDLEIYASKGGQTIDYFLNHYSEISNKEGYNIFCWYGVNGATRQGGVKTATAYNKLASDLKGKSQIFVGTIGHCPNGTGSGKVEGGAGQSIETQNKGVEEFNEALKGKLSSDIKVIDTYTYIKQLESEMGASKMTTDNLHYTKEASEKIKSYVESQIASMSGSSGNSTASASMGGTYYGQINITLSGYVDAKDTFSKYKQGSGIWDEYYDSLSPSDEEGESSENSDSSNTNSSSAEPSGGSNTNSSNSSSAEPSGGSNNHNNGNNSLNTNSNNGSVINNSNNSTNTNNGNTNNSSNNESSLIQGDNSITDVYKKGNVTYVVNTVEYGEKNNIKEILDYFKELNEIQDDSLDVLQIIYEKILKRQGKTKKPIPGLNFDLKTKHGMVHNF